VQQPSERVVPVDLPQQALEGAAGRGVDHRRHLAEQVEEVVAHVAVVGQLLDRRQRVVEGVDHQVLLAGPAPVQRRLPGLGAGRDPLHGQAGVADRLQLVDDGVEDRLLEGLAAAPGEGGLLGARPRRRVVRPSGHRSTSKEFNKNVSERLRS
jgi:hypothetical protein